MYNRIRVALNSEDWLRRAIDLVIAALLYRVPSALRQQLFRGNAHVCPLCQSQIRGFLILHRPSFRWCPVCRSLQRHRLVWLLFERRIIPYTSIDRLLHIAPEQALAARFRQLAKRLYLSADLFDPRAQMRINLERLPFARETFDFIFCSHVLEHIPDDRTAMSELWRTLKPGGIVMVLVPLRGEHTLEDSQVTDPHERERLFGQFDHVRWYGQDIIARLTSAGLTVKPIAITDIVTLDEMVRYGLTDEGVILLGHR